MNRWIPSEIDDASCGRKQDGYAFNSECNYSNDAQESMGNSKGKKAAKASRPKPTQAGYMNDAASLVTSNVYEDANANSGKAAMPVMTDTCKRQAMTSLISSIPVENKAKGASEKEHILRVTTILGSCRA